MPGKKDDYKRSVPNNVKVVDILNNEIQEKITFNDILYAFKITLSELLVKFKQKKIRHFKKDVLFFISKIKEAKALKKFINENKLNEAVFYSVWAYNYATVLAILNGKRIINKVFCRAHGFDIYHFRRPVRGYAQFLDFNLKHINKVISASDASRKYISQHHSSYKNKINTIHLSVYDRGDNPFNKNSNQLNILSVSNNNPVKRLPLLVSVLKNTNIIINWIHIGVEPQEMQSLSNGISRNVTKHFLPRINQVELTKFYLNNPINLFLQFSESEGGVPLAIQESISFGIPVLATNVGGIPEIVNEKNGILLPKDFDIKFAAGIIDSFIDNPLNTEQARATIKEDWKQRFNAETNFANFAKILLE